MRNLVGIGSALLVATLVACGSQAVEFADGSGNSTGLGSPAPTDSSTPPPPPATTGTVLPPPADQCVDANCPVGQVCVSNVCTVADPCAGVTCPQGDVCRDGACVAVDPCAGVTCPEGSACTDGTCTPVDPCAGVTCPEGSVCKDEACPPVDPCAGVVCPEGRVCKDGACVCEGDHDDNKECRKGKTLVCHRAGPHDKKVQLCVADAAVPAHLKHGDKVGDCESHR